MKIIKQCERCSGKGKILYECKWQECPDCRGNGFYEKYSLSILIIALTLFIFLIPFSSAQNYLPQRQNTNFELIISSNNATGCNWTYIQYPDGSKISSNLIMTRHGTDFNYTIDSGNFSQLGSTCMGITCYDGNQYESGSVCREVNPNGIITDSSQGMIYLALISISIGLLIFFLVVSFSIEGNNEYNNGYVKVNWKKYIRYFLWFMAYLMLIFVLVISQEASDNFLWFSSLSSFFHMMFILSLIGLGMILLIGIPMLFISLITDRKFTKLLQRNLKVR